MRPSLADAPEPRFSQRSHVSRRVPLAPLVRRLAAVRQLRRGPLPHQALVARVVAGVAVVLEGVGYGRKARGREPGGGRQLRWAAPVERPATVELLLAGPTFHPLERTQVVVARRAVKGLLRGCGRRGRRGRRRRRRRRRW